MSSVNQVINFIICIFEIFMLFDFFNVFFEIREIYNKKRINIFIVLFFSTMVYSVNLFDSTLVNLIGMPIIYLVLCIGIFKGNIYKKLIYYVIAEVILFGTEFLCAIILSLSSEEILLTSLADDSSVMVMTIIMKLVTLVMFIFIKQFASKSTVKMEKKIFFMYIVVPTASIGFMISVMYCGIDFSYVTYPKVALIVFFTLLLFGNLFIFWGFNMYSDTIEKNNLWEREIWQQKIKYENYEQLEEANNRQMQFMHDFKHYILTISELAHNNKISEMQNMIEELTEEFEQIKMIEYSNNSILNTILSDYKAKTEKIGVLYEVFIEPCFNIEYVDQMDLVSMLGNVLANALEAAEKSEKKWISVKMFMQNDGRFSVIKIENTYVGEIKSKDDRLVTTKADKAMHGIGLVSANSIAEKYNGYIHSSWSKDKFKNILILQNNLEFKQ